MDAHFENLQTDNYNRRNTEYCRKYAESFDEMLKDGKGLLMWGNTGTGKSYTAAAIANRVCDRGFSCVMIPFAEIIHDLVDENNGEDDSIIRQLIHADLVVLDDFDTELCKESTLERLYDFIDERYQKKHPMIITTKLTPHKMNNAIGTSAQIYDRFLECCYLMQFTGPNRDNTSEHKPSVKEIARRFLEMTVPSEKLREICRDYSIEADEGVTYRDLLRIAVLKRAHEGDKEAAEFVREFGLNE